MTKRLLAILIVSTIVFGSWGGQVQGEEDAAKKKTAADEAYEQAREKRREAGTEERLAITKEFLEEFPESKHTASAISAVFYYQGNELGDMAGAITYAEAIRSRVSDPEIAQEIDKKLVGFYGESGMTKKMLVLADELAAAAALDFRDHWNVIESAVNAEDWKLARDYCAKARGMANAETFRAEYPDHDLSDEEVIETVNNRVGMLLVKDGWARANQGEIDEALADFAKADNLIPRYYFDMPEYYLNTYWARVLMMKGNYEAAIGRFATDGLIMRNEEALAGLKEAYVGLHGSESGFEVYSTRLHRSIARTIDDFEMADYKGERHRFSDLRSDVTLLRGLSRGVATPRTDLAEVSRQRSLRGCRRSDA
jgi:tetratricopeptide (TPR) repeat protein